MTTGADEVLRNLRRLQVSNKKVAREAVKEGAELFADILAKNTPEGSGILSDNVSVSGFKGANRGLIEKDIGYNRGVGYRVKYPDTGTVHQRPQNFVERTIKEATPKVLDLYSEKITKGLSL